MRKLKNKSLLINILIIYFLILLYLHQKVNIFVKGYQLKNNYQVYNELLAKRDYLLYNFSKEISLVKLNQWAESNQFSLIKETKILALKPKRKENFSYPKKLVSLLKRIFPTSASSSVLAEDNH